MYNIQNIDSGTILKVYCPDKLVWHYGIMSYNGQVIDRAKRGVKLRSWSDFSENYEVKIVPREYGDFFPETIHERAVSLLGQSGYNMIFNNCEHFVSWCRKNKFTSKQLNVFIISVIVTAVVVYIIRSLRKK